MKLSELTSYVNDAISLRNPNKEKIEEYAERMEAGAIFPPIVIGHWPKSEKYGESGIVDGLHRLAAADKAKLKDFPTETKKFPTLEEALQFMYVANMTHGIPVTEGQRNKRIVLLKQIDPNLTLEKIASVFKLGKSSVDRILKGAQGEGKSGPKGANKSKGQKSQEPLKAKGFFSTLERLDFTLSRVRPTAEIVAYAIPETESGVELDEEKAELINTVIKHLQNLRKALDEK